MQTRGLASEVVARSAVDGGEKSANNNPAIGLQAKRLHVQVGTCAGIESDIQCAIGVEPRDAIVATSQHLAVNLQS